MYFSGDNEGLTLLLLCPESDHFETDLSARNELTSQRVMA
jgi:hypothetical protein